LTVERTAIVSADDRTVTVGEFGAFWADRRLPIP